MDRPVLFVLAGVDGVDGAGKRSVGGHLLAQARLSWFNPDTFARELMADTGRPQDEANAAAWHEGVRRLDEALAEGRRNHAFETTLGGGTIPAMIRSAARSHEVMVWYCGLSSLELNIARVKARVAAGGHDIPEAKIRERCRTSPENLIALLPHLAHLQVYDNSVEAAPGKAVPDPVLVAQMQAGRLVWPTALESLQRTPPWARPLLEAALSID